MSRKLRIGIVAGEASGDLLGAHLVAAIKKQYPHVEFIGIAGPKMTAEGCHSIFNQEILAVRGFIEVVKRLPQILRIRKQLIQQLTTAQLDIFIGIDAPDFNFSIEKCLKKAGIPTIHYVSPSIWAWRPKRVHKIVRIADRILCLFPMEPNLYIQAGGQADFVGHPLAETIALQPDKNLARMQLNLDTDIPIFTLLPGSRSSEVDYMASCFFDTAKLLLKKYPKARILLPTATQITKQKIQYILDHNYPDLPIQLLDGQSQLAIIAADVVLVSSGTATLEVALCKRPMVISYKINALTFRLVKSIYQLPYVGLPNILAGRFVVPEILQKDAQAQNLSQAILDWYQHPQKITELQKIFTDIHLSLKQDSATLAAKIVLEEIKKHHDKTAI